MSDAEAAVPELRRLRLRYAANCSVCATELAKGVEALYDPAARTVRCVECPPVDAGSAGNSARREYERRKAARQERVKGRFGNLVGSALLAMTDDPQSTRAWARGAVGEEKLAEALAGVDGLRVLHDRRVPGTRGNIDHLVIAPAGVFVVDAKRYRGLIRIRDRGGWFKTDLRLYVGTRDCSKLAENMSWQVGAVRNALGSEPLDVTPVLSFIDGEWPLLSPPDSYSGVRLEGKRSIKKLVTQPARLDAADVGRLTRLLAAAFPPK